MKRLFTRSQNVVLWGLAALGMGIVIYLLFSINIKTDATVTRTQADLSRLQRELERDHDRQDQLLRCLVELFVGEADASQAEVEGCIVKTSARTPAPSDAERAAGTAPAAQGGVPATPVSGSNAASSSETTPPAATPQPNSSQPPPPEEPPTLAERVLGVIEDIPLVGELAR